jgi:hypothetical protein
VTTVTDFTLFLRATLLLAAFVAPIPASAGWLDDLAVAETHRLEPGKFYQQLRKAPAAAGQRVAVLPVALDRELAASFEYGDREVALQPVLGFVQGRLAGADGLRMLDAAALPADGAPRVYVGSAIGDLAPPDAEQQASPGDRFPPMVLHVERPSKAWAAAARELMAREGLTHLIVPRLGVSQYPKGRRGVFAKNLLLGTGYEVPVKFLTAEDKLMQVLQVTGLLVDAEGRVVRAGAEGALGRDTPFKLQIFDVEKLLDDEALQAALTTERRKDLPGEPLALEVAVDNLVAQLLQDAARARQPLP